MGCSLAHPIICLSLSPHRDTTIVRHNYIFNLHPSTRAVNAMRREDDRTATSTMRSVGSSAVHGGREPSTSIFNFHATMFAESTATGPPREVTENPVFRGTSTVRPSSTLDTPSMSSVRLRMVSTVAEAAVKAEKAETLWGKYYEPYRFFPLVVMAKSLLLAWIYTIIPLNNYWVYFLVKTLFWCIVAQTAYVESLAIMLPDVPDSLYILAYVGGIILSPSMHSVLWFADDPNSFIVSTFASIAGFFWAALIFGLHGIPYPHMDYQMLAKREQASAIEAGVPIKYPGDWAALYAAIVREDGDVQLSTEVYVRPSSSIYRSVDGPSQQGITLVARLREDAAASVHGSVNSSSTTSSLSRQSEPLPKVNWLDSLALALSPCLDPKYFWFLPRYWDYEYYLANSKLRPDANRRYMWLFAVLFMFVCCVDYTFLCLFTNYFRTNSSAHRIVLFGLFIVVNTFFRYLIKALGMTCDRKKVVTASVFFLGEAYGVMFYYTFYRVLFESIKSVPEFAIFQVLHLASEWILYVFRATEWYYNLTETLGKKYFSRFLAAQRLPHKHWQRFMALDFGIRCTVFVITAFGMFFLITTVQFVPYLNGFNGLKESDGSYELTMMFIGIALVLESINAVLINQLYFVRHGLQVREETIHCFALRDFSLLVTMNCAALFINPIFAFTTIAFVAKKY